LKTHSNKVKQSKPGIQFETIVADIQVRIDPNATVVHDKIIVDRIGQKRQFDVVIEGKFAGQDILGVIECKDHNRKLGTPAIDAFITKAQDINANFKVVVAKKGFTKPAIEKAKHYGIQTLSLIPDDDVNLGFKIGNYWHADLYHWEQLSLSLVFVDEPDHKILFSAQDVRIHGKRIIDWFTNYLIEKHPAETKLGWVVDISGEFDNHQLVEVSDGENYLCKGLIFRANRGMTKKQFFVGIKGTGFFDWQKSQATIPPNSQVVTDGVPMDFTQWEERESEEKEEAGFLIVKIIAHSMQFSTIDDVIDLDLL